MGRQRGLSLHDIGKRRGMTIIFSIEWTNEDNSILPESTLLPVF